MSPPAPSVVMNRGVGKPRRSRSRKELEPGLAALFVAQGQRDQNLPAVQGDAPGAQDGFTGDAVGAQRFVEPIQEQAQERYVTEVTVLESFVFLPENLGHLAEPCCERAGSDPARR